MHLLCSSLKQPPTSGSEEGVSTKQDAVAVVAEVSPGMAGGFHHSEGHPQSGQQDRIPVP